MPYKDEFVGLRFFALSLIQIDELRELFPDVQSRPTRRREGLLTGSLTLRPDGDYSPIKLFINRHAIQQEDFGIFVSVSTSSDSEIVRLPQFAANLFREVGGQVDFSFTVLSED